MNKKPTVCLMVPVHYSWHLGGAEYQAALITEALSKIDKYNIYYLCHRADRYYIPNGYKIKLAKKQQLSSSILSIFFAKKLYGELLKLKPDIIYQRVGGIYTGVGAFYAKKAGVKFIWQISSDADITPQWNSNVKMNLSKLIERLFLNYGIRNATVISAQTRYQADLLKKKFGIECQAVIPNGHPFPNETLIKTGPIRVLWIANLKPLKQPEIFVRLAQHFRRRDDVRFIMIGRQGWGTWFEKLKKEIQTLPNLDYVGELTQDQVNQHLNRGHILVNTSRYEGFSNTFVQAWMRKVPVVSLTVDPDQVLIREKIGFKSKTFEQLCQDVNTLVLDSAVREQMGAQACCYAQKNHTLEKMFSKAIQLFE